MVRSLANHLPTSHARSNVECQLLSINAILYRTALVSSIVFQQGRENGSSAAAPWYRVVRKSYRAAY